ncbi:MAG: trigger factor [Holosporales bacterium]|jgi:trigger factor|nr:trigger factor [Holosporales bacterium]
MNLESIKVGELSYEYRVIFSAEEVENQIKNAVKKKAKTFKMQGFRPGHVPLDIVRKNVEWRVVKDVLDSLASVACDMVIRESKAEHLAVKPAYLFENRYEKGKGINLKLMIEKAPSFELHPYELEVTKILPKVEDSEIEENRKCLMINSPIYEKAESEHVIKVRDEVSYIAVCYNNGVESRKKSFDDTIIVPEITPDENEFIKGIIGKKAGDSFEFVSANDKNLTYKLLIKSVKKALTDLPPEEFAKRSGFKNLKDLDATIKERLEKHIDTKAFMYHKSQILEVLEKQYEFELPKSILDREMEIIVNGIKAEYEKEEEKDIKEGKEVEKKTESDLRKECEEVVRRRVLLGYVLNKISQKEKIFVTDREVQDSIAIEISENPEMREQILLYYSKNPNAFNYRKAEIIERKVISFLISKAKVTEVAKTKKEVEEIIDKLLES